MRRWILMAIAACSVIASPAMAMADDGQGERGSQILEAMDLPVVTQELRDAGVQEAQISESLGILRERPTRADDAPDDGDVGSDERAATQATRVLRAEAETAREHGPMENLGEFVRDEVEKGARGQDLAESIRAQRDGRSPAAEERRPEAPGGQADERRPEAPGGQADERRPEAPGGQADERRPDRPDSPAQREEKRDNQPDKSGESQEQDRPERPARGEQPQRGRGN